jgi:hypothetical protein
MTWLKQDRISQEYEHIMPHKPTPDCRPLKLLRSIKGIGVCANGVH